MKTTRAALSIAVTALLATACSAGAATQAPSSPAAAPTSAPGIGPTTAPSPVAEPTAEPTPEITQAPTTLPTPEATVSACAGEGMTVVAVSGRANIFGAGRAVAPDPGGGGGGQTPPRVDFEIHEGSVVTFPCTSGVVNCCAGTPNSDPAGPAGTSNWYLDV